MSRLPKLVIAMVAAVALAAVASGISYAAASGKSVYACSSGNGVLRLLNAKGKCPKHYSKVALDKQGPAGKTGPQGKPGPGAVSVRVETTSTTTTSYTEKAVPGLGLILHPVCLAGSGNPSALYLIDSTGASPYSVRGSYDLTTAGGRGYLVNNGGPQPNLAAGQGLVSYDQPAGQGLASELIASDGAQLSFDVLVVRGSQTYSLHGNAYQASGLCEVQAVLMPTS